MGLNETTLQQSNPWALLILILIILGISILSSKNKNWLAKIDLVREHSLVNFYQTLAVTADRSNDLAGFIEKIAPIHKLRASLHLVAFYLKKGQKLSTALYKANLLNNETLWKLQQAENINKLNTVLQQIAAQKESAFFNKLESYAVLAEPAIIVLLGFFIGFTAMQIILPVVRLTQNFL